MATIKVKNPSSIARSSVITFGIPFSRGFNLRSSDTLAASNAVSGISDLNVQWYRQGSLWDNGAIKYARCAVAVDLDANEEKEITVSRTSSSTSPGYAPQQNTLTGLAGTNIQFNIQGTSYTLPMSTVLSGHVIEGNSGTDHYRRIKFFTHLPATSNPQIRHIWVDLVLDLYDNTPFVTFFFRWGYYKFDPGVSNANGVNVILNLTQPVTLSINGPRSSIRWEEQVIPSITEISSTNRVYNLIDPALPDESKLGAGSSYCYKGVFAFDTSDSSDAELDSQILAMAVDWKDHYPITGIMPDLPDYITSEQDLYDRSNDVLDDLQNPVLAVRSANNWPTLCNNANITSTGTHGVRDYAYGMRGWPFIQTTNLNWIPLLEFSTRAQAMRHNWYYNDQGNPVPPTTFRNAGVVIWNGSFHITGNGESFAGYNDLLRETTVQLSAPSSVINAIPIYGPDKEHFTNKLFILQGLITMDWFSLEYAKMYSKYFIYAHGPYYYGGWPSDANLWGAPRAIGRTSESIAWLLDFYDDSELRTAVDDRLNYNLSQPRTALLDKSQYPGGLEVIRASVDLGDCNKAACLHSLRHWRPWEEGQFVLGQYLLAKQLLSSNPSDATGLRTLETTYDVAASTLLYGYFDGRTSTQYRFITLLYNTTAEAEALKTSINGQLNTVTATGLSSGAVGTIFMYHNDTNLGGTLEVRGITLCLKGCTGSFNNGETVSLSTGITGQVYRKYPFLGGAKSIALNSPTNGYAREITQAEREEAGDPGVDVNYGTHYYPVGNFRYNYWFFLYEIYQIQAAVIARLAAREGYYDDNPRIIAAADDLINYYKDTGYNTDNGDIQEQFLAYTGYFDTNLFDISSKQVLVGTNTSFAVLPSPTVTVENNSTNVSRNIQNQDIKTIRYTVSSATAIASNGSTDVNITVPAISFNLVTSNVISNNTSGPGLGTVRADVYLALSDVPTVQFTPSTVQDAYTSTYYTGKKVFQYVYIGEQPSTPIPTLINEVVTTIGEIPNNLPLFFAYHRILPVIANNSPITNYYTQTPITPIYGLLGEALGLNGQSLGSQGYSWQLPSSSSSALGTVLHNVETRNATHTIGINSRGYDIQSWDVTLDGTGNTVTFLTKPSRLHGVVMNETFDLNRTQQSRLIYNPNFGGAVTPLEGTEHTYVSPNRLQTKETTQHSTVFGGAVTPLESTSYVKPYKNHTNAYNVPAIARDMKKYYNLSIGSSIDADAVQLDSWSFHAFGIPKGPHQLLKDLSIDIPEMFNRLLVFDPERQQAEDLSLQLLNTQLKVTLTADSTVIDTGQAATSGSTLPLAGETSEVSETSTEVISSAEPSLFSTGSGAIICENTDSRFVVAVVAKLENDTSNSTTVNELLFENIEGDINHHRFTVRINNEGEEVERNQGWIGSRMYILFDTTVQNIQTRIINLYENQLIDSTLPNNGIYIYERPAII